MSQTTCSEAPRKLDNGVIHLPQPGNIDRGRCQTDAEYQARVEGKFTAPYYGQAVATYYILNHPDWRTPVVAFFADSVLRSGRIPWWSCRSGVCRNLPEMEEYRAPATLVRFERGNSVHEALKAAEYPKGGGAPVPAPMEPDHPEPTLGLPSGLHYGRWAPCTDATFYRSKDSEHFQDYALYQLDYGDGKVVFGRMDKQGPLESDGTSWKALNFAGTGQWPTLREGAVPKWIRPILDEDGDEVDWAHGGNNGAGLLRILLGASDEPGEHSAEFAVHGAFYELKSSKWDPAWRVWAFCLFGGEDRSTGRWAGVGNGSHPIPEEYRAPETVIRVSRHGWSTDSELVKQANAFIPGRSDYSDGESGDERYPAGKGDTYGERKQAADLSALAAPAGHHWTRWIDASDSGAKSASELDAQDFSLCLVELSDGRKFVGRTDFHGGPLTDPREWDVLVKGRLDGGAYHITSVDLNRLINLRVRKFRVLHSSGCRPLHAAGQFDLPTHGGESFRKFLDAALPSIL